MAETSDQIVEELQVQRERLSKHVNELESYVRDKADLRTYYFRAPWKFVGGAVATGMLLALMTLSKPRRNDFTNCR